MMLTRGSSNTHYVANIFAFAYSYQKPQCFAYKSMLRLNGGGGEFWIVNGILDWIYKNEGGGEFWIENGILDWICKTKKG